MTADEQVTLPAVAEQQDPNKELDVSSRPMTEQGIVRDLRENHGWGGRIFCQHFEN
ncbi:hypothetical protein [Ruegeria arenilitoris]|uniref:hypothetical protein n=1 Tax=Ruegeria arenilitoris TaxID=1173585 RepID=UPI00147A21AF|nr:hypothetical protein [Ruegeria arenilitoris]